MAGLRHQVVLPALVAQFVSSLGDWIGLIAILAIAARVSNNSGAAVSLVMTTRVLPGFLLGTVGGVIIDRFDRRKVMVLCDIGRASLLVLLPFVESLAGLLLISLGLEVLTLLWGPAQAAIGAQPRARGAALVGELAVARRVATARSRSRRSSSRCSPAWRRVLGDLDVISAFKVDQEFARAASSTR